ncbi:MAG TPA: CAP domain-containing protein [Mycobacteriales bacterium]|nr:CAP domain-containing protein [Mycobacteriales bacterium]
MLIHLRRALPIAAVTTALLSVSAAPLAVASPTPASHVRTYDKHLLSYVNHARVKNGGKALKQSNRLYQIALKWAKHEAAHADFNHNPNYPTQLANKCPNWRAYGENTGWQGTTNSKALFKLYMSDPIHKGNILNPMFKDVGIATVKSKDGREWNVMDFASHCA